MRVLFVTSEIFPLAKTGGLADVAASLPAALAELGVDVRILLPAYPQAVERAVDVQVARSLGKILGAYETRLLSARLPGSHLPLWLVDCPGLFERAGGPYQDATGRDWDDNAHRFAVLSHAAVMIAGGGAGDAWRPDIVHGNDWHAGLIPLLLSKAGKSRPKSIHTVHNLGYQGLFPIGIADSLNLPTARDVWDGCEFYGRLSFLKAGLSFADALTTVSPNYAKEILTPEHGHGLDGVLRAREADLQGILNGVDYAIWDPSDDPHLPHNFSSRDLMGKRPNKAMLQHEFGLDVLSDGKPLIAWMSRLAHQKMPDTAIQALPALLDQGVQFALVAEGDHQYEAAFRGLAARYPGQVAVKIGYDELLAHRLLAGADMLLHPARYEPCGLAPMYALRYGAVPVVRRTGGLVDSIVDVSDEALRQNRATGFSFEQPTGEALVEALRRAVALYALPLAWRKLQSNAMRQDFSWRRSAEAYAALYGKVLGFTETRQAKPRRKTARLSA